jgi:hypothetical protein
MWGAATALVALVAACLATAADPLLGALEQQGGSTTETEAGAPGSPFAAVAGLADDGLPVSGNTESLPVLAATRGAVEAPVTDAPGAAGRRVHAAAEVSLEAHRTYGEACEEARNRALMRAVAEVGTEIAGVTALARDEMGTTLAQFVQVFASGKVVRVGDVTWDLEWRPRGGLPPDVTVRASLDAEVIPETVQPDSTFRILVELDPLTLRSGETVKVRVTSSQVAYLRIFNQTADGQVTQLFPNPYRTLNRVEAHQRLDVPGREDPFELKVSLPPGRPRAAESIVVVATKGDVPYWTGHQGSESLLTSAAGEAIAGLSRWLASIRANERAVQVVGYTVFPK